jgi:hypothetical protein
VGVCVTEVVLVLCSFDTALYNTIYDQLAHVLCQNFSAGKLVDFLD